jgi:hypothetical protein
MSGTPPRPRRLRALLVAGALSVSMFATALPAAAMPEQATPPAHATGNNSSGQQVGPASWIWVRSVEAPVADDELFTTQSWIWVR